MPRLEGKVALVTGAARGIGREVALRLAREGANLVLCDICKDIATIDYPLSTEDDLNGTARQVKELGVECLPAVLDVREQNALDDIIERAVRDLGAVDIAVTCAGIVAYGAFDELTDDEWNDELAVNLTGSWHTAKAVAPHMKSRKQGCIVFFASVVGAEAGPYVSHYAAAKHGVIGLMRSVALELAPYGIRANAILPGTTDTTMNDNEPGRNRIAGKSGATREEYLESTRHQFALPGQHALPPSAHADAVAWLVSDDARLVTGIELRVDGGHGVLRGYNPWPAD
jgi:SDR family mycofactocin-dependent oxidoreductase